MASRNDRTPRDVVASQNAQASRDLETEQELAKTRLERDMFSRLVPLLEPVKGRAVLLVGLELLLVGAVFLRPFFIGRAIDRGFFWRSGALHVDARLVAGMVVGLAGTYVLRCGISGASQYVAGTTAIAVLADLRRRVFAHVQTLSVRYFDRTKAGRIVSRADRDVDTLEPLLIQGPPELLSAVLRCVGSGALLYALSPALFLGVFAVVPVLAPAIWLFHRISSRNWARVAERRSRFTSHLVETVNGVRVLQQAGREAQNRRRYQELLDDFTWTLVRGNIRASWFLPLTAVLSSVGTAIVVVLGARGIVRQELTLGQVTIALFYVNLFLGPLQELGDLAERYASGTAAAQRIFLLLDTRPEIVDGEAALRLEGVRGHVRFEDVTFSYDPKRGPVISGFVGGLLVSFPGTDDPWTLAPALARETRTFRFMIAFQPGFVNPVHAARLSASLQRLTGGRLVYNVITGGGGPAQLWWGDRVAHDDRYARTAEFLDVLKGVWKQGPFDFDGRFFKVQEGGLPPPLSEEPVPEIYFSGSSDAAIAAAGRHADYYLSHLEPFDTLRAKLDRVKERAAREGRTAKVSLRFDVLARRTPEEAWAEVERGFATLDAGALARLDAPQGDAVGFARQREFRPKVVTGPRDLDVDAHVAPALWGGFSLFRGGPPIGVVGSYEQAAEWLDRYIAAGVDSFVLAGTPHLEEAYRVGEEVLPLVLGRRDAGGTATARSYDSAAL